MDIKYWIALYVVLYIICYKVNKIISLNALRNIHKKFKYDIDYDWDIVLINVLSSLILFVGVLLNLFISPNTFKTSIKPPKWL